jgi:hypothetical protein
VNVPQTTYQARTVQVPQVQQVRVPRQTFETQTNYIQVSPSTRRVVLADEYSPAIPRTAIQEPQVMLPTIPRTLSAPAPTGMPQLPHFRPCGVRAQQPFCAGAGSCTNSQRTCFEKSEEG